MENIVILDQPLFAEGLALLLRSHMTGELIIAQSNPAAIAPQNALVLVELFLPDHVCGLRIVQQLQHDRPDLIPILWTAHPTPLHSWAALEYRLPSFLDKAMPLPDLLYWFEHATANGAAWPRRLLVQARGWSDELTLRLRSLTQDLWMLWAEILTEKTVADLTVELGYSHRTIERRLAELYMLLGVRCRAEAVNLAWKWQMLDLHERSPTWTSIVVDLFYCSALNNGTSQRGTSFSYSSLKVPQRVAINR